MKQKTHSIPMIAAHPIEVFTGGMLKKAFFLASILLLVFSAVRAVPSPITGTTSVGPGWNVILYSSTPGGTWTSGNTAVATVNSMNGVVTGVAAGTSKITYTVSGSCVYATVTVSGGTCNSCPRVITTLAGCGTNGYSGDGSSATAGKLSDPYGAAVDKYGNVYIADKGNSRIRKVSASGIITTFAGNGTAGYSGDGGAATAAKLNKPSGVACDTNGNVYIADQSNHRIRKVNTSGIITTLTGTGTAGYSGDGGPASAAKVDQPINVATDVFGNVFVVDFGNSVIRKITSSGIITTVAGTGTPGFSGEGGPATAAKLYRPTMMACDLFGNLFIDDENNGRIRKVNTSGIIHTIAGDGTDGFTGDGGPASAAKINECYGVCTDICGNVYIADLVNQRIRMIDLSGMINTICGTGVRGALGDHGPATAAQMYNPYGICMDNSGNIYFADNINQKIRKLSGCVTSPYITGSTSICAGTSTSLYNATSGGTWSSSNGSVATVGSTTGIVNGLSAGTATITYTASGCFVVTTVTVYTSPGSIVGGTKVGVTGTLFLINSASGGIWTSSDTSVAHICGTCGDVLGKSAGTTIITYSLGSCYVTSTLTVVALSSISGSTTVCTGVPTTLGNSVTGGVWMSNNTGVAKIGLTTGILTGVISGTATISYKAYGAIVTTTVTVHEAPEAITGPTTVAVGGTITLNDATAGGKWKSSNISTATIDSLTGVVNGIAAGVSVITYKLGYCYVNSFLNIIPVAPITGTTTLCVGTTSALSDSTTGGTWCSRNTGVATVNSSGVVYGVAAGSTTISYTVAGYSRTTIVTIKDVPTVGAISGFNTVNVGETISLRSYHSGGIDVWSSSCVSVATVDYNGIVTGVANGTAVITYAVTNDCGTAMATTTITVTTGANKTAVCSGSTISLSDVSPGGTWTSSNTSVAAINCSTGVLTGVSAGTVYITYHNGGTTVRTVTVLPLPSVTGTAHNITCHGYTNGYVEISTNGGSTNGSWLYYTYQWSNGATTNGAWALCAGSYSVIATDPYGCSGTAAFTITEPDTISHTGIVTDTLVGCKVGRIDLSVAGGTPPYTYSWSNVETTQDIYGLLEGEYYVNIRDANNCAATGWYYVEYCVGCHQSGERRTNPTPVPPPVNPGATTNTIQVKAYPNPFVSTSNITFTATEAGQTTVEVINAVNGEKVATIFNEHTDAGTEHSCVLNGDNLAAGIYLYKISSGNASSLGKLVLTK